VVGNEILFDRGLGKTETNIFETVTTFHVLLVNMAQAGGNVVNVSSLFGELHHLGEKGDFERALKVANKSMESYVID
jgi:hypothetical protein